MAGLQDQSQWNLILRGSYQVQYSKPNQYTAIQDILIEFNESVIVAGGISQSAKAHWYLAANITQYLDISPTTTNQLQNFVKVGDRQKIPLGQMAKLEFQDYGIYPYHAKIEIPYYIEDVALEIWEFTGQQQLMPSLEYISGLLLETSAQVDVIDLDLDRIEQKIDTNVGQ